MLVGSPSRSSPGDCRQTLVIDVGDGGVFGTVVFTDPAHRALASYGALPGARSAPAPAEHRYLPAVHSNTGNARQTVGQAVDDTSTSSARRRTAYPGASGPAAPGAAARRAGMTVLVAPTVYRERDGLTTLLQVMNVGTLPAVVEIGLLDEDGMPIDGCGDACRASVDPESAHDWWLADLPVVPAGTMGSALVTADQPIVGTILDMRPSGDMDAGLLQPITTSAPAPASTAWFPYFPSRSCAKPPTDLAVVLDASTSMMGPRRDAMRLALLPLVSALDYGNGDQAALVTFNSSAQLLYPLGADSAAFAAALSFAVAGPGSRLDLGVVAGQAELAGARHRAGNQPVLLALTDGRVSPAPASAAVDAAAAAKSQGTRVITLGLGGDVDADALRAMASTPVDYHSVADERLLNEALRRIAETIRCP
jgi:uncharacterized protein YegL